MNYRDRFVGVDTVYPCATGESRPRIHLDGAASPLVMQDAVDAMLKLLPHYSNSHSYAHSSAEIMSTAMTWSMQTILKVTGANDDYTCVMMGSGSTALLNNVARRLANRQNRNIVLVSALEHHANDLPHRHNSEVIHFPVHDEFADSGDIDLAALEQLLEQHQHKISYVSVSAVSNVTGIISPIKKIIELAHQYDIYVVLDCAQMAAHMPLEIAKYDADFVIFSGHKVYAGAAPGVMIAKKSLLEQYPSDELGGGIVEHVSYRDIEFIQDYPARELPGTKNFLGAYALATVLDQLSKIDLKQVYQHSKQLWAYAYQQLSQIPEIRIYGQSKHPRLGALAFNIDGVDHGLAAAILSDYYAIATRNECFCAHPYVSALLKEELWSLDLDQLTPAQQETLINRKRGMLRASFSLYNTNQDIDALCAAINDFIPQLDKLKRQYNLINKGDYQHKTFSINPESYLLQA